MQVIIVNFGPLRKKFCEYAQDYMLTGSPFSYAKIDFMFEIVEVSQRKELLDSWGGPLMLEGDIRRRYGLEGDAIILRVDEVVAMAKMDFESLNFPWSDWNELQRRTKVLSEVRSEDGTADQLS